MAALQRGSRAKYSSVCAAPAVPVREHAARRRGRRRGRRARRRRRLGTEAAAAAAVAAVEAAATVANAGSGGGGDAAEMLPQTSSASRKVELHAAVHLAGGERAVLAPLLDAGPRTPGVVRHSASSGIGCCAPDDQQH